MQEYFCKDNDAYHLSHMDTDGHEVLVFYSCVLHNYNEKEHHGSSFLALLHGQNAVKK